MRKRWNNWLEWRISTDYSEQVSWCFKSALTLGKTSRERLKRKWTRMRKGKKWGMEYRTVSVLFQTLGTNHLDKYTNRRPNHLNTHPDGLFLTLVKCFPERLPEDLRSIRTSKTPRKSFSFALNSTRLQANPTAHLKSTDMRQDGEGYVCKVGLQYLHPTESESFQMWSLL